MEEMERDPWHFYVGTSYRHCLIRENGEVQELTPVEEETVWQRISGGFVESLHSVADGFVEFSIWLIVNSPFLVIWAVIIVAAIWLLRKWKRKNFLKKSMSFQGAKKEEITRENEKNE